jgi:hypothetical protein
MIWRLMSSRTVYEGSISVSDEGYAHFDPEDDHPEGEVEIEGLDEKVTRLTSLTFVLDYPFERPYHGTVGGEGGVTLRQIIDAIRVGCRVMYRDTKQQPIPTLDNKLVDGPYGRAYHDIGDLVIESIELDETSGALDIFIGS